MKTTLSTKQNWLVMLTLASLMGCATPPTHVNQPMTTAPDITSQNFREPSSRVPNAVESAIELSQKVAQLSEQLTALREEKLTLTTEKTQYEARLTELEPKLQQANKELTEANDLLIEMRLELNNWKENVLGFSAEMREADQAQLDALLKILQLLGGEIMTETPNEGLNNATASDSNG